MFDPRKKHSDHELMELAVKVAEKSVLEDDGRSHPMVGAVIARDGYVLRTGFRGEKQLGAHAEESALAKLTAVQAVVLRYTPRWNLILFEDKWPAHSDLSLGK